MTDLSLETRAGLPDTLAYLRASFPQADWRKHPNFGELSAFWLQVHDHLRGQGSALNEATSNYRKGDLDPVRFRQYLAPTLSHFLQHLNGHHQIEDRFYFPRFRALDDRMVAGFELLERDHEMIHEALLATVARTASCGHPKPGTRPAARQKPTPRQPIGSSPSSPATSPTKKISSSPRFSTMASSELAKRTSPPAPLAGTFPLR